jgi:hypothetical protein
MLRPNMNLRVGYANVRGLSPAAWEACHQLLNTHFDYLFLAETWFVNHRLYSRDRRFIAASTPAPKNLHGRPRGGIYLLGSCHARSKVGQVQVTEYSITFSYGKQAVTGVYFPPTTLTSTGITSLLDSLKTSTVILGDINTRFRDPLHQAGDPGPPERLQVWMDFLTKTDYQHLKPAHGRQKLTTDHCFVQSSQVCRLELLDNASLKIPTDHKYTLHLTLGHREDLEESLQESKRFRVSQLSNPDKRSAILDLISRSNPAFTASESIDEMNTKLVHVCQQVQEQTIGRATSSPTRTRQSQKVYVHEQTVTASIRLYKSASQSSEENNVIFPTAEAADKGIDAAAENLAIFQERWSGQPFQARPTEGGAGEVISWTRDQVVEEIQKQEADKCCGADGTHIRFLKAVQDTAIITWLGQLYNRCLAEGQTPRAWNESAIFLLTKDVSKKRDAKNLRPISIICIFRKVFERLLLLQAQNQPWARLHPAQAGFRRSYSTYSNAAVVHALLSSKSRSTALFLDFKSAFDVVDHQRLDAKLAGKGCPETIRSLIQNLMFRHLKSRILINGRVTDWFPRSRGALQGSPLSPWLFNLFVDDLLYQVNEHAPGIPLCLFYADDGVIVTDSKTNLAQLLRIVEDWTVENAIFLNPAKCAVVTSGANLPALRVYGQEIPRVESYTYLGFPVTANGIDFQKHLEQRMQAAIGRATWLGMQSDSWGPAHRLRVYKQFLAPMFEYGAPLVWAWARENEEAFHLATARFKELMAWVSNTSDARWMVTANLCGISSLPTRFQRLSTAYQFILERMGTNTPLQKLLSQANPSSSLWSFTRHLGEDRHYSRFKATSSLQPTIRTALSRFLKAELHHAIRTESLQSHLTSIIPVESRKAPGLLLADISLAAPVSAQGRLLQYRRGAFMYNYTCACSPESRFRRGHEDCGVLHHLVQLSRPEQRQKQEMKSSLCLSKTKFTNLDFLLNTGQLQRASWILAEIQRQLGQVYKENQINHSPGTGTCSCSI